MKRALLFLLLGLADSRQNLVVDHGAVRVQFL